MLPPYIQYLLQAESYPHQVTAVTLVQTHVSYLLFAGQYVYKWKKPVNLGFVNFSTLERRRHFCEEEVRLNSRLCRDIYLGVVQLSETEGRFHLGGDGTPFEYGVKMRRLPESLMMDRIIADDKLTCDHLTKIINRLVAFYSITPILPVASGYGSVEAVAKTIRDNLAETRSFVGDEVLSMERFIHIEEYAEQFLHKRDLFAERVAEGRIRDCHGDLHSANICLTHDVAIFDCIEFNEELRCTDTAADVAFLAMDLDYHNLVDFSNFFVDRYIACSGDRRLRDILDFYKCYRAYVRGKIGLLTAADKNIGSAGKIAALKTAERYFRLAEEYADH